MKAMFEVIKHEGDTANLVYRFEGEDFNTQSRLIVQQGQEAIFYYKGQLADRFSEPGTYVLSTDNIPILRRLINLPFGRVSPFHAVVYFINKTEQLNNRWGAGDIPFIDRKKYDGDSYDLPLKTGLCGEYNFRVNDAELLMNKLVGTQDAFSGATFRDKLDSVLKSRVVEHMTNYYQDNNEELELFTLEDHIGEIAEYLKEKIAQDFRDYGIEITKFVVVTINKSENSAEFRRYFEFRFMKQTMIDKKNANTLAAIEAEGRMNVAVIEETTRQNLGARAIEVNAQAEQKRRELEGITRKEEHAYRVAELTAQNEGAGAITAGAMGIGMGVSVGHTLGGIYQDALSPINSAGDRQAEKQEQPESDIFAGADLGLGGDATASDTGTSKASRRERLQELKELFEDGLITQEEFDAKKKAILEEV